MNDLLHTPEGVRDIYGAECRNYMLIRSLIRDEMALFGYEDIKTPTFEFFDVFAREISTMRARDLYKFFDKEGNTLVLRSDFTPQIARCVSKYYLEEDRPVRLSYGGDTFLNTSELQGKMKESTQMGAELMNEPSVYADAEMIAMLIQVLLRCRLSDFQISVGNADVFRGICEEAGIDEETELMIREQIAGKNEVAAEHLMTEKGIPTRYRELLLRVPDFMGSVDSLKEAESLIGNERSVKAIERLKTLYEVLSLYQVENYISFDLGMLSKYNYYTGVIFKAYTYGVGDAIATGGRYDNLLGKFGKSAPAIGFMIVVDDLMNALNRQGIRLLGEQEPIVLRFREGSFEAALKEARHLRLTGHNVVLLKEGEGTE